MGDDTVSDETDRAKHPQTLPTAVRDDRRVQQQIQVCHLYRTVYTHMHQAVFTLKGYRICVGSG